MSMVTGTFQLLRLSRECREMAVLAEIGKSDAVSQRGLARAAGVSATMINAYVDDLVGRGLLEVTGDTNRTYRYHLAGPGVHPRSTARALGAALHHKDHGVIVHPIRLKDLGWFPRHGIHRRVAKILAVHHPDVIHVFSSEPWIADAFTGHGISVVHSTLDQASHADWVIAPSQKARASLAGRGPGDNLASWLPYPIEIGDDVPGTGDFGLALGDRKDRTARKWV